MGWLGNILKGAAGIATSIIPGPIDDFIVDAASKALGGSGQVSGRSQKAAAQQQPRPGTPSLVPVAMQRRTAPQLPDLRELQQSIPRQKKPGVGGLVERILPGGETGFVRGAQLPIVGAIATEPEIEQIERRDCGPGRVLAMDGLCYPKRMLPASFRMHRPAPKPVVSASDRKAIRKANAARKRLVKLTKDAGAHASLTKPRRK